MGKWLAALLVFLLTAILSPQAPEASIHGSILLPTQLAFVATRSAVPHRQNVSINSMTTRTAHIARDNITQLKLLSGNWFVCEAVINGSCATQYYEQGSGASQTRTAVFEYPAGTYYRVTWGGNNSVTETNGQTDVLSDWINVTIPKGATFWTQEYTSNSAGIIFLSSPGNNEFSTALGDKTVLAGGDLTGTAFADAGAFGAAGGYGAFPMGILAMTSNPAVLMIGTSRVEGIEDTVDSSGDLGSIARSIGPYWGYVNGGVSGDHLTDFVLSHAKRATLGKYATHVIFEGPTNDDISSPSTIEATMQSAWAVYSGQKVYSVTCDPETSSTDLWATTANQTITKNFSTVNTYINSIPAPLLGAFDITTVTANQSSGKWNADGSTARLWTYDGIHEVQYANLAIQASGVIPALTWKASPPLSAWNGGEQSRGILIWSPGGVAPFGCNPSTCYTGGGGVATQLASAKLSVLTTAQVGHVRYGIDPSPVLADPTNTSAYVTSAFLGVDILLNAGLKVVINNAPSTSWSGWTEDDIEDGGHTSANFLAYISYLQTIATHVAGNQTKYPASRVAFSLFNETPYHGDVDCSVAHGGPGSPCASGGGITEQYLELKAMYSAVRAILPRPYKIILCLTDVCSGFSLTTFNGWSAADFDPDTVIDVHAYMPLPAAFACQPSTEWRDICGVVSYPPTASSGAYNTAKAAYEANLAADNTWAGDCPSGPNCTAARAANKAQIEGNYNYDGLLCYYGQSPGIFPCPTGAAEDSAWLASFQSMIVSWLPAGVAASQIWEEEFGGNGVTTNGTGLDATSQAHLVGDFATSANNAGFGAWAVLEVNYSSTFSIGSGFGMVQQYSPYALVNPAAMTALGFNGL